MDSSIVSGYCLMAVGHVNSSDFDEAFMSECLKEFLPFLLDTKKLVFDESCEVMVDDLEAVLPTNL